MRSVELGALCFQRRIVCVERRVVCFERRIERCPDVLQLAVGGGPLIGDRQCDEAHAGGKNQRLLQLYASRGNSEPTEQREASARPQ